MRVGVWTTAAVSLLAVFSGDAVAQEARVAGRVLDADGRALAHVQVMLLPGQRQSVTDTEGRFELRRLPPGSYRLEASLMGYAPVTREVRVGAGGAETVEVMLRSTPLSLSGIQVTASPSAREPNAVTQATTQLSGKALQRELGSTIAHTLRYQPGVSVRLNGPGAAMPMMRGLTGDRVLVLQDGQRTADLSGSADDHGMTIDPLAAQRVEVVRGPATLLYGNNALGGVVNVISGDISGSVPLRPQLGVSVQTETAYPGYAVSARGLASVSPSWSVIARGGVRRAGDMRIAADPVLGDRLANSDRESWNAALGVSRVAESWSAALALRAYDFGYGLPAPIGADPVDLRGSRTELVGRGEAALPWRVLPSVRLDATVQDYAHDEVDVAGVVAQRFELDTRTANVLVRQAAIGRVRDGAWGASLLQKDYASTGPSALTPAADSRAAGVFAFQEVGVGGAGLQLGGRYDRYVIASRTSTKFGPGVERVFNAFSGSAGVRVPVTSAISAGVTMARSFRAPTVEELFSAAPHAGTGSVEYGNPMLREERGRSIEAVLHVRGARVNAQFAAYRNRVDDYIQLAFQRDTVIGGATLPVYVYTQAQATLRGVEGSLEVAVAPRLLAAVRGDWLEAEQRDGTPLSYMPPPRAGFTLRWDNGRHSLGGDVHREWAQTRIGIAEETPTDAHNILRLDASTRFNLAGRAHTLSLRVDNLTDAAHREATSRIRDFAPAPGRNIALLYNVYF